MAPWPGAGTSLGPRNLKHRVLGRNVSFSGGGTDLDNDRQRAVVRHVLSAISSTYLSLYATARSRPERCLPLRGFLRGGEVSASARRMSVLSGQMQPTP